MIENTLLVRETFRSLAEGMATTPVFLPRREFLSGPITGILVGLINKKVQRTKERERSYIFSLVLVHFNKFNS